MTQNGFAFDLISTIGTTSTLAFVELQANGHGPMVTYSTSTTGDLASPMEAANAFDCQRIIHGNGQMVTVISVPLPVCTTALEIGSIAPWATSVSGVKSVGDASCRGPAKPLSRRAQNLLNNLRSGDSFDSHHRPSAFGFYRLYRP